VATKGDTPHSAGSNDRQASTAASEAAIAETAHATAADASPADVTVTDTLAEYRSRRDFSHTAEPPGERAAAHGQRRIFCVQKHAASRLHYDFRLELEGVLKSWAIPKGPSLDPHEKRLAVMVEDHPLEYAAFEGTIPKGEYGGGTVMLWDTGWWEPDTEWVAAARPLPHPSASTTAALPVDATAALQKGELKFVLHGKKLTGSWALVQMKSRGPENWLLLKHADSAARPGSDVEIENPDSAATGRSLEEIAAAEKEPRD
jgi:bifunctional non-homologous end joining protein LigD